MKADTISMQESKITACLHNRARLIACEAHVSRFENDSPKVHQPPMFIDYGYIFERYKTLLVL